MSQLRRGFKENQNTDGPVRQARAGAGLQDPPSPPALPSPTHPWKPLRRPIVLHLSIRAPWARLSRWPGKQVLIPRYVTGLPGSIRGPVRSICGQRFLSSHGESLCSRTGWLGTSQPPPPLFVRLPFLRQRQPASGDCPAFQAAGREKPGQSPPARKAPFYSLQDRLDFLGRVYRVAKPVSEATGLSLPFILAHAAHEVQFGKNIMENNLFNLKADKDWQGSTHLKGGNEYRSYPSYEESMKDYLAYLQPIPDTARCSSLSRGELRHARRCDPLCRLQRRSPLYLRILAAAKDPIMKQALWQYQHWPP